MGRDDCLDLRGSALCKPGLLGIVHRVDSVELVLVRQDVDAVRIAVGHGDGFGAGGHLCKKGAHELGGGLEEIEATSLGGLADKP